MQFPLQAGLPATDSIAARQQGDFGQSFDCCTADFNKRIDFYIGYEPNWRQVGHCGAVTSVYDGEAYSTTCVGEGDYLFVTGGSSSDGWLLIAEVEVIGVPNNYTSLHTGGGQPQMETVAELQPDGTTKQVTRPVTRTHYAPSRFDCNNWFGRQPGVQYTSETISAHDVSRCSQSLYVDFNSSFDWHYAPGTLVPGNASWEKAPCKFARGAKVTPQDVVLDTGALSKPVRLTLLPTICPSPSCAAPVLQPVDR
eukprot:COSAG01_NODE_10195_length_2224_cov_1.011765_2_plen_253_part_00